MKKHIAAVFACLVISFVVLDAHVIVTPRESAAGAEEVYTVSAMAEGTVSATTLELEIPAGMHVMQVAGGNGITFDVKKDGDRIVVDHVEERDQAEGARALYLHGAQPATGRAAMESASDVRRRLDEALGGRARLERPRRGDHDRPEGRSDNRSGCGSRAQARITGSCICFIGG